MGACRFNVVSSAAAFLVLCCSVPDAFALPLDVLASQKISTLAGGFSGQLDPSDGFGTASTVIGDLDGDGVEDMAVGAPFDDDGGTDRGAVWILFLNADGTVASMRKISDTQGGFTGVLDNDDHFGNSVAALGDLDGDGVEDLAVGAPWDDDHASGVDPDDPKTVDHGAIWVLFLRTDGTVKAHQKISVAVGGFPDLHPNRFHDEMAYSLASRLDPVTGKLRWLAAGAAGDDDGGPWDRGAVWVLKLKTDGTVQSAVKISDTEGGFTGVLDFFDRFGTSVAWLGDVDGDGLDDLAVGAPYDDDGAFERGAVWILFLKADGTVKSYQKLSATSGGLSGLDNAVAYLGYSLASMGDVDGNGVEDLAVGVPRDDETANDAGTVWLLLLKADGTVKSQSKIGAIPGPLQASVGNTDAFGASVTRLSDLNGDGIDDMAVGAQYDDDGGTDRGAVWLLFLADDGTVMRARKISDTAGGFFGILDDGDLFGKALADLGDLDGDGVPDVAVGAPFDDDGGLDHGAVWVLFLTADGTVKSHRKISQLKGGFTGVLNDHDWFGYSLAPLGDLDGDGVTDLAVGAVNDRDGGAGNRGAVWILFLKPNGTVKAHQKISVVEGNFDGAVDPADDFGRSLAVLDDIDGDGIVDLAVGASRDDDGGTDRGAVWVLRLNADGTVKAHQKISDTEGGFTGILDDFEYFGWSVSGLPDLDGDGVEDLAVGALYDGDGGVDRGAAWVLFLRPSGKVKARQKISSTQGGLIGPLDDGDYFGASLGSLGDHDHDGNPELLVGATGDDDGGPERGALWELSLSNTGNILAETKISSTSGGFDVEPGPDDFFGASVCRFTDLDGDGYSDLAVGATGDDDGGSNVGAMWVLFLGETTTTTTMASTTTTTLAPVVCGDASGDGVLLATDALIVLRTAVGADSCAPCICDVDSSSAVKATDALKVLQCAVGQPVELVCPPC